MRELSGKYFIVRITAGDDALSLFSIYIFLTLDNEALKLLCNYDFSLVKMRFIDILMRCPQRMRTTIFSWVSVKRQYKPSAYRFPKLNLQI